MRFQLAIFREQGISTALFSTMLCWQTPLQHRILLPALWLACAATGLAIDTNILVLENPYFAVADCYQYAITNVPPGRDQLKVWHQRMPPQITQITVPEIGELKGDFVLGINNLRKL